MLFSSSIFALTFILTSVYCEKFRYDNYSLYNVVPTSQVNFDYLISLQNEGQYDFWTDPVALGASVQVLVSPARKDEFVSALNVEGLRYEIAIENIQSMIEHETVNKYITRNVRSMQWDAYYNLDDIYQWLDDLAAQYPDVVTMLIGGTTYEGRQIKGIKISHGSGKRAVFIEGGIHSREWISPATVNYITDQLLTSTETDVVAAAHDFDWYIFPVTNPDGYVWTHESARMWRKNRRPYGNEFGVDLNRNWNSNWLAHGASTNPAIDTYAGPGPFSEIETRTLSDFISGVADQLDMYLSFHSYSQLLLIPFGNTTDPLDNYYDTLTIGRRAMGSLAVKYGTHYVVGNIAEAIYQATGGSVDWVKEFHNVPIVYCYELRDTGATGFLLPADQILPNNEEVMDSLLALIYEARRLGYMNSASALSSSLVVFFVSIFLICNH